jgi:hypothetical protein
VNLSAVSEAYRFEYGDGSKKPYAIGFSGASGQALLTVARFEFKYQRDDSFRQILDAVNPVQIDPDYRAR